MKRMAVFFLLSFFSLALPLHAAEQKVLRVATRHAPPFSFKDDEGLWRGITIELWQEIARANKYQYTIQETSLDLLLQDVEDGTYDIGAGAITITSDRERAIDFSQPYLTSFLGLAYIDKGNPWIDVLKKFMSLDFLKVLLLLTAVLMLAAVGVWLFERKGNEEFGGKRAHGLGAAFWWAAVTMTTVGYGDKAPRTAGGRVIGLIWMFASIIILTSFTAAFVSGLTLASYHEHRDITDLAHRKVGTINGSVAASILLRHNMTPILFEDSGEMINALVKGKVTDVLHDLPVLQFYGRQHGTDFRIDTLTEYPQSFGFALTEGAPFENALNVQLLRIVKSPYWKELRTRYNAH